MPRKLPRSTKFEKYERCNTFDPAHRMSASSTKSITKLSPSSRIRSAAVVGGRSGPVASSTCVDTFATWPLRPFTRDQWSRGAAAA